jgi:hypothetical protein
VTYSGGGGGGVFTTGEGFTRSSGGAGGGGAGGDGNDAVGNSPVNGTANLGGGAGGAGYGQNGANGGSGVVIIAYPDTFAPLTSIGGTLVYDQPTRSGYRVYRFTAGTGTVTK